MKKIKLILSAIIFSLALPGCYTVIWNPDMEFPNEDNSDVVYNNSFYFGDLYNYYCLPWWFRVSDPGLGSGGYVERTDTDESIRNGDSGRRNGSVGGFITPGTPGRSSNNPGSTTTQSSGSNDNSSGSRNSSTDSSRNESRNNDSGRNTDKGKR
jgi:hypothetical protein